MAKLIVEGHMVSGAVDNAASISCLDRNGNKSTVQAELDKKGNGGGGLDVVEVTQAEFDLLSESAKENGTYLITDAEGLSAKDVVYDGTMSVKDAIDEQNKKIAEEDLSTFVTAYDNRVTINKVVLTKRSNGRHELFLKATVNANLSTSQRTIAVVSIPLERIIQFCFISGDNKVYTGYINPSDNGYLSLNHNGLSAGNEITISTIWY